MKEFSVNVIPSDSNDYVVVKTTGSINSTTASQLDAQFEDLMSQSKFKLVVDLSDTDFISSSGIGVLLGTATNLRNKGGDLILMSVPKLIEDIFVILNIKNYFQMVKDASEIQSTSKA